MLLKRKIFKEIYCGTGKQALYLILACTVFSLVIVGVSFLFHDNTLSWKDALAIFYDTGNISLSHPFFRLIVQLMGMVFFSSSLITLLMNVVKGIGEAYLNGTARYNVKDHTLIFGFSSVSEDLIRTMSKDITKESIVVLTMEKTSKCQDMIQHCFSESSARDRVIFYSGDMTDFASVKTCNVGKAKNIYIVGDAISTDEDRKKALSYVDRIVSGTDRHVNCFVVLKDQSSQRAMLYEKNTYSSQNLTVEYIPYDEYLAEHLLVYSECLPDIHKDDDRRSSIVIMGHDALAVSVGKIASTLSHYPNYIRTGQRTIITFMDKNADLALDSMVSLYPGLMSLSRWKCRKGNNDVIEHFPDQEFGDFLDVEWEFLNVEPGTQEGRAMIESYASDTQKAVTIIACGGTQEKRLDNIMGLPELALDVRKAIYIDYPTTVVDSINASGVYGREILQFGPAVPAYDATFKNRFSMGQRVNWLYYKKYGSAGGASINDAWSSLPEFLKLSNIYCANALPLRARSVDADCSEFDMLEMEHRRWMSAVLVLGYRALPTSEALKAKDDMALFKEYKKKHVHPDILPFVNIPYEEQVKDKTIIDGMDYIINGND